MADRAKQRGVVLVVSLIMLVVLTLLVVAAVNMSTTNLHIIRNMQSKMDARDAAEQVINQVVSNVNNFTMSSASTSAPDSGNHTVDGYQVTVQQPVCISATPARGWEQQYSINPTAGTRYNDNWSVTAQVTGGVTNSETSTVTQGVEVQQMLTGCP